MREIDILIFSPHPDDETLACGGTIIKAIKGNKRVKVIFLTNGDAYTECLCQWLKKDSDKLMPNNYIALGEKRQKEALRAIKKLGLKKEDAIFLSYPDSDLFSLWGEKYKGSYIAESINRTFSPYKMTYKRAKRGFTKENLLFDIKEILTKYRPKKIYLSHPLDEHRDHQATTHFVSLVLEQLRNEGGVKWINSMKVSYYLIHYSYSNEFISSFSQKPPHNEDIIDFKNKKAGALKKYHTQLNIDNEFLKSFIKDNELFWG